MTAALAWLAGTRAGRWIATAMTGALITIGILARVYGAGQRAEESRQARDSIDDFRSRNKTDAEVAKMGAARQRGELASWVRNDG